MLYEVITEAGRIGFLPHNLYGNMALEIGIGLALGAAAAWGVVESLALAALFTLIEVAGLLIVSGAGFLGGWTMPASELVPGLSEAAFPGLRNNFV